MLSFKEAKGLIEDYEKIENEVKGLTAAKRKIDLSIEEKIRLMTDIEAVFDSKGEAKIVKAIEGPDGELIAAPAKAPKEEFIAAHAKAPKEELKASPYRIKGEK